MHGAAEETIQSDTQSVIARERLKILRGSMNGAKVSLWSWSEAA